MYEVPFKKDDQIVVLMTTPYKRALMRLAQRTGTDMSHFVRQAIVEYIESRHEAVFNQLYDESLQDYTKKEIE